ncbi:MAG: zf-HC2 domain-containing protein [Acidobacteria bacterium]|nr:zf-HC2 domain-containing protein [Acidobacteriota bacterium]
MAKGLYDKAIHAVRYFLLRRLPTCKQMAPVMSESLERRLTLRERAALKLHLWVCVWCVWYLENLRTMREALRARGAREEGAADVDSAVKLSDEARERIRRALAR